MRCIRRHATYANVVASLALFVALGGASYAAVTLPSNSVGRRQIRRNAVTSSKVRNGSLLARDFKKGQLKAPPRGPAGPAGPKGDPGPQGLQGLQGVQGVVSTASSYGQIGILDAGGGFAFAGPSATVTTTSAAQKILVSASGALGAASTVSFDVGVCEQASGSASPPAPPNNGANYANVTEAANTKSMQTAHALFAGLPAGTYRVGLCARSSSIALNVTDYSNAIAVVADS